MTCGDVRGDTLWRVTTPWQWESAPHLRSQTWLQHNVHTATISGPGWSSQTTLCMIITVETSSYLARSGREQREWKLNVVFLISISELWLRCRYFSIPRGLHNYRTEGKNIWFKINKGISMFGFLPQQLLPRILPVLMVNSKPEIRAKFDSPDFVENNEAMLREEFSKYFQVRNPVQPSYRRIVT